MLDVSIRISASHSNFMSTSATVSRMTASCDCRLARILKDLSGLTYLENMSGRSTTVKTSIAVQTAEQQRGILFKGFEMKKSSWRRSIEPKQDTWTEEKWLKERVQKHKELCREDNTDVRNNALGYSKVT